LVVFVVVAFGGSNKFCVVFLYCRYYLETSEAEVAREQKEAKQPAGESIGTQELKQAKKAAQEEFLRKKSEVRKIAEEEQLRQADERRNAAKDDREKKKQQEEETRKKAVEARKKVEEEARIEAARKRRGDIQVELSKQPKYDRAPKGVPRVLSWAQRADGT
jgi:membrane protein involved in colicin uptake